MNNRRKMTDREAVKRALFLAIEWERSLLGSEPGEDAAALARFHIRGFERVLDRRYGAARMERPYGGESISLAELLRSPPRAFDPSKVFPDDAT
jgi:hypothetical protein